MERRHSLGISDFRHCTSLKQTVDDGLLSADHGMDKGRFAAFRLAEIHIGGECHIGLIGITDLCDHIFLFDRQFGCGTGGGEDRGSGGAQGETECFLQGSFHFFRSPFAGFSSELARS